MKCLRMTTKIYQLSELLVFLAALPEDTDQRIPSLIQLSKNLGISVATLREQLEEARSLGLVEVRPKAGIKKLPYDFSSAIKPGLVYAVKAGNLSYHHFADLRRHLESAYFIEAAQSLLQSDIDRLSELVLIAQSLLRETPVKVPVQEHREFHLCIYKNLKNQYLNGVLDAFWEVYHLSGMEIYPDVSYIDRVWQYHQRIVDQIRNKNYSLGLSLLTEHMELANQREKNIPRLAFE